MASFESVKKLSVVSKGGESLIFSGSKKFEGPS